MLKRYLESKGSICPQCGSDYLVSDGTMELASNGDNVEHEVACDKCSCLWVDVYEYKHYEWDSGEIKTSKLSPIRCPHCYQADLYSEDDYDVHVGSLDMSKAWKCPDCNDHVLEIYTVKTIRSLKIKTTPSARFIIDEDR
jgi:Zn finger protein HypA/HybF involved in hydrogenase expression